MLMAAIQKSSIAVCERGLHSGQRDQRDRKQHKTQHTERRMRLRLNAEFVHGLVDSWVFVTSCQPMLSLHLQRFRAS
jgi:hypothetical protein